MLTHGRGKLSLFFPLRRGGAAVYSRTSLFHAFGEETYFTRVLCRIVDILNLKTNKKTDISTIYKNKRIVFCESRLCFNAPPFNVCQPSLDKGSWLVALETSI